MMKKRKVIVKEIVDKVLYDNRVLITIDNDNNYMFEAFDIVTNDIVEGIILCMLYENTKIDTSIIWKMKIYDNNRHIVPEKSLYWLSGGNKEWNTLNHYNTTWSECHDMFSDYFGEQLEYIAYDAITFGDIRDKLMKDFNLIYLYEFALSKNLIK